MFKYSLNIGALIGIAIILLEVIFRGLGQENNSIVDTINYVILALGLVYGIKTYRNGVLKGYLNYGDGVKLGLYISLAVAFLVAVFSYIYAIYDPEMLETAYNEAENEIYADEKLSDEEVEISLKVIGKVFTPGVIGFFAFFAQAILGLIFSLIISAFLKNPEPMFEDNHEQ